MPSWIAARADQAAHQSFHRSILLVTSTKSAIGHLLGAAGSVEAIFSIKALQHGVAPPTINLTNPSEGCDIDLVANQAKERRIRSVMSQSFGCGGTTARLIFRATPYNY